MDSQPGSFPSSSQPAIVLEGVRLSRGGRVLIDGLSWVVPAGGCAAVLGPNGAGKSTLLSIVGGFIWPQEGRVRVLGAAYGEVDLPSLRRRMGFAGQSRMPQFHPDMTALETVLAGLWGGIVLPPRVEPTEEQMAAAREELATVGLAGRAEAEMERLSSGEQARALVARALVARPELLILDEPTMALDLAARAAFVEALDRLMATRPGLTILLVSHHVEDLPRATNQVLLLSQGRAVAAGPPAQALTGEALSRAYGCEVELFREDGRFWTRARRGPAWNL
jgi:iron complex transport system ATP-binding protein